MKGNEEDYWRDIALMLVNQRSRRPTMQEWVLQWTAEILQDDNKKLENENKKLNKENAELEKKCKSAVSLFKEALKRNNKKYDIIKGQKKIIEKLGQDLNVLSNESEISTQNRKSDDDLRIVQKNRFSLLGKIKPIKSDDDFRIVQKNRFSFLRKTNKLETCKVVDCSYTGNNKNQLEPLSRGNGLWISVLMFAKLTLSNLLQSSTIQALNLQRAVNNLRDEYRKLNDENQKLKKRNAQLKKKFESDCLLSEKAMTRIQKKVDIIERQKKIIEKLGQDLNVLSNESEISTQNRKSDNDLRIVQKNRLSILEKINKLRICSVAEHGYTGNNKNQQTK